MGKIRDITFDIAKGIGIVLVVIGHYIPDNAPSWYIGFVSFVYHFHMPLFLMIAGSFYASRSPGFDKRFISSVLFSGSRVFFMVCLCFVFNILYRPGF